MAAVTHHLLPEPGVTEIRIHGVGGTTPEALLNQTGVQQVTGDHIAGMYRGAIGYLGRTVEAYSWGGLTARSRSRAFWVLLLPFCLINLSGWMVEPAQRADSKGPTTLARSPGTKWHEVFVQLIGLCATALYVMWAALLAMNTLAFQCAGMPECRDGRWYLDFFGASFFADHPGRRVLVGLLVPLGLLAVFVALGYRTMSRYDNYGTNRERDSGAAPSSAFSQDDQQSGSVLGLSGFWYPGKWQSQLVWVHVAAVLLLLAGLLGRASREFETHFAVDVVPDIGYPILWVCGAAAVVLLVSLAVVTWRADPILDAGPVFRTVCSGVLAVAAAALATAVWLTSRLDVADDRLVAPAAGASADQVSRPNTDLWGFGWTPILLLVLATVFIALFSIVQVWRWLVSRQFFLDQFVVVVMLAFIVFWRWAALVAIGAALLAIAAQWLSRRVAAEELASRMRAWRLLLFLGVCAVGALVRVWTADADSPFGVDWPRLTPVLLFTAILVGLSLVQTSRSTMNNADGRKPWSARTALMAIPAGMIGLGLLTEELLGRSEWFYGAAWLAWTTTAIVWLAQFRYEGFARWRWNGPAAVAVLALAILIGAFSGLVIWLVDLLDRDRQMFELRATGVYEWTAVAFAATLLVIVVGMLTWYALVRLGIGTSGAHERGQEALPEAIRATDVVVTMGSLLLGWSFAAFVIYLTDRYGAEFQSWIDGGTPASWAGLVQGASWVALGVSAGAFLAVRQGMRDHGFRTRFGVLWDVGTFWPRWFHPFAPPAYSMRAVPELQARITEIVTFAAAKPAAGTRGEDDARYELSTAAAATDADGDGTTGVWSAGPSGAAIVSAHSQGSVVSLAAVASLRPEVLQRIRLVTHGSPLARFYQRYFPAYFSPWLLEHCARKLGGTGELPDGTWLNYWRPTDPIGDPVFGAQERTPPKGSPSPAVRAALKLSRTGDRTLPDVRLDDPVAEANPFAPPAGARGHSGYMADPAMWRAIDALAAELANLPAGVARTARGPGAGRSVTGAAGPG